MTKYLATYAYDTFSTVQGVIDLNIADTYGMDYFLYEGNLIKDSRCMCIEFARSDNTKGDVPDLTAAEWQGKNPDVRLKPQRWI